MHAQRQKIIGRIVAFRDRVKHVSYERRFFREHASIKATFSTFDKPLLERKRSEPLNGCIYEVFCLATSNFLLIEARCSVCLNALSSIKRTFKNDV
jgi:hypothetical protein